MIYNSELLRLRRETYSSKTLLGNRIKKADLLSHGKYLLVTGQTIPQRIKKDRRPKLIGVYSTLSIEEVLTPFLGFAPPFLAKASLSAQNCRLKHLNYEQDILRDLERYKYQYNAETTEFLEH